MREISFLQAIQEALKESMRQNPDVFIMGEDIGVYGGAFGVTRGMIDEFGKERIIDTPISEAAITGIAIGAAMMGMRPILEIMFMDFITLAMDQIINNAAKFRYIYGGQTSVPIVIRTPAGSGRGYGASHSQSLESIFLSVPGIKIVVPSTPYDAKGLLKTAIEDNDPVLFVENKNLYATKGHVPEDDYQLPFGKANIVKSGSDLTIIAHSRMNLLSLEAAKVLEQRGISVEVVDPRTIVPLDLNTIAESVKKTGRLMIVEEGYKQGGVGSEICARVSEIFFEYLKAPIRRLGAANVPIPFSESLEKAVVPDAEQIVEETIRLINGKEHR